VSQDADLNQQLMKAAESGDADEVRRLITAGADVNFTTGHGFRPLLMAVYYAHLDAARILLSHGADPNYTGFSEGTALVFAAGSGHTEILSLLLDEGADVNLALPRGGETALHVAIFSDRTEVVQRLLQAGANVNQRTATAGDTDLFYGGAQLWAETPLHFAAAYAGPATIEALLAAGADKTLGDAHGVLPIAYAGRYRRPQEVVQLLR
jgi:ankyrin repeat protein